MNMKTFNKSDAIALAVAYAGYSSVRIHDLDTSEDVLHAISMIEFLSFIQTRVGVEMVSNVELGKKKARMERLNNVYNTPDVDRG